MSESSSGTLRSRMDGGGGRGARGEQARGHRESRGRLRVDLDPVQRLDFGDIHMPIVAWNTVSPASSTTATSTGNS